MEEQIGKNALVYKETDLVQTSDKYYMGNRKSFCIMIWYNNEFKIWESRVRNAVFPFLIAYGKATIEEGHAVAIDRAYEQIEEAIKELAEMAGWHV